MDDIMNRDATICYYKTVKLRPITTAEKGSDTCIIVEEGYFELQNVVGDWLTVKALHISKAVGTIVSPTYMALENTNVTSCGQITHPDAKIAELILYYCHEYRTDIRFHLHHHNNCWFIHQGYLNPFKQTKGFRSVQFSLAQFSNIRTINSLNKAGEYEIWHQRLLNPGTTCMDSLHKCVDGIPHLTRHQFHKCDIYQE